MKRVSEQGKDCNAGALEIKKYTDPCCAVRSYNNDAIEFNIKIILNCCIYTIFF